MLRIEKNNCYNIDCKIGMQLMKGQGLKADWVITDPPYGISVNNNMGRRKGDKNSDYAKAYWDKDRISKEYFDLMFEVANKHIIFGGNYYTDYLPPTKSWIVWDKMMSDELTFSQVELAWTNADFMSKLVRQFPNSAEKRIHATQKPIAVLTWILNHYTKEGDLILDPFAGSQSLRIACHKLKRDYIGFEIDKDYYEKGTKWFNEYSAQISIFDL